MFRPSCRTIFRLIFEQLVCTFDNALKLLKIMNICSSSGIPEEIIMLLVIFDV